MSEFPANYLLIVGITCIIMSVTAAAIALVVKRHTIKKIIALTIFSDSIALLMAFVGYRPVREAIPPVRYGDTLVNVENALGRFVDPIPHALVVTSLIIGLAFTLFLVFVAERMYSELGVMDLRKALTFVEGEPEPEEGAEIE